MPDAQHTALPVSLQKTTLQQACKVQFIVTTCLVQNQKPSKMYTVVQHNPPHASCAAQYATASGRACDVIPSRALHPPHVTMTASSSCSPAVFHHGRFGRSAWQVCSLQLSAATVREYRVCPAKRPVLRHAGHDLLITCHLRNYSHTNHGPHCQHRPWPAACLGTNSRYSDRQSCPSSLRQHSRHWAVGILLQIAAQTACCCDWWQLFQTETTSKWHKGLQNNPAIAGTLSCQALPRVANQIPYYVQHAA